MNGIRSLAALLTVILPAAGAAGGTIVQNGSLPGPGTHDVVLDQFDTLGGTRQLDAVTILANTFFSGGYQTDGSGIAVDFSVTLSADYFLDETLLVETEALVAGTVPNTTAIAVSFFDNDQDETTLLDDLGAWSGKGTITLTAITDLVIVEDPPGIIGVGAGGSAQWTVTYDYSELTPCPADLDGSGDVGFPDLTQLLGVWGPCAGCAEDLDGDLIVGFTDLTALLAGWGICR
jgi:hypothetical protein